MTIKVHIKGLKDYDPKRMKDSDLLLQIIKKQSSLEIELVESVKSANFIIIYPYLVFDLSYKIKFIFYKLLNNFLPAWGCPSISWLFGLRNKKSILVSPENLDHPYWWRMLGSVVLKTDFPRLTFWPEEIDPIGERFPYWYNYVDWPEYPRNFSYDRFGRLYDLEVLMKPLNQDSRRERMNKAILVASHILPPRVGILNRIKKKINVDIYGLGNQHIDSTKHSIMSNYKYCICPENSIGYGYETEKLPESWMSGCIPLGYFNNPFGDFNTRLFSDINDPNTFLNEKSLLDKRPSLKKIESYVKNIL